MGEQDSPAVANEVVERDRAVGGVGLEVGGNGAETETVRKWHVRIGLSEGIQSHRVG